MEAVLYPLFGRAATEKIGEKRLNFSQMRYCWRCGGLDAKSRRRKPVATAVLKPQK